MQVDSKTPETGKILMSDLFPGDGKVKKFNKNQKLNAMDENLKMMTEMAAAQMYRLIMMDHIMNHFKFSKKIYKQYRKNHFLKKLKVLRPAKADINTVKRKYLKKLISTKKRMDDEIRVFQSKFRDKKYKKSLNQAMVTINQDLV